MIITREELEQVQLRVRAVRVASAPLLAELRSRTETAESSLVAARRDLVDAALEYVREDTPE